MTTTSPRPQPLQGKRVLVTALDLEQREHRGIAVYSKALIRHLRQMGAEVWLLTQFPHHLISFAAWNTRIISAPAP